MKIRRSQFIVHEIYRNATVAFYIDIPIIEVIKSTTNSQIIDPFTAEVAMIDAPLALRASIPQFSDFDKHV